MAGKKKNEDEIVLGKLRQKCDTYSQGIVAQTQRVKKLETHIKFLNEEVRGSRKKLNIKSSVSSKVFYGEDAVKENDKSVLELLKQLEKRMNGLKIRNNELSVVVRDLKLAVNNYRRKKVVGVEMSQRLTKKFQVAQKDMAGLMAESNETFEERDALQKRIQALMQANEDEQEGWQTEMDQHAQYIKEQRKINEQLKRVSTTEPDGGAPSKNGDLSISEEQELRQRLQKFSKQDSRSKKNLNAMEETVMSHEDAFSKLRQVSGIQDLAKLVDQYVSCEDEIFSLYNYIQSVNQDVAESERKVQKTMEDMNKHMHAEGNNKDKQNETLTNARSKKEYLVTSSEAIVVNASIMPSTVPVSPSMGAMAPITLRTSVRR